jgi:hypothetical protein
VGDLGTIAGLQFRSEMNVFPPGMKFADAPIEIFQLKRATSVFGVTPDRRPIDHADHVRAIRTDAARATIHGRARMRRVDPAAAGSIRARTR